MVDNYSKKVLSHLVSAKLSARNRLQTIREAYENELSNIPDDLTLMVDGGSENNNAIVDSYVGRHDGFKKIRALHDIKFGNSQVEAHNRILKHNWLYHKLIESFEQLEKEVSAWVQDFNEVRPHYSLNGMTPEEIHCGIAHYPIIHQTELKASRKERYEQNKCNACAGCTHKSQLRLVD